MGFAITLLFIVISILSPADMFPALAPYRIILVLSIIGFVMSALSFMLKRRTYWPAQVVLLPLLILSMCLSHVMHGWFGGIVFTLTAFVPTAMFFLLAYSTFTRPWHFKVLAAILAVIAIGCVARGMSSYYAGDLDDAYVMPYFNDTFTDDGEPLFLPRIRALGYLNDPNDFGQFLCIAMLLLFLFWRQRNVVWNVCVVLIPSAYILYGIFYTRSRGALVTLAVLIVVAFRRKLGAIGSVAVGAVLIAGLFAIGFTGGRVISIAGGGDRLDLWSDGLGMFKSSPVWGVGFRNFSDYSEKTAHNSFVLCFAELGMLGYTIWLMMNVYSYLHLRSLIKAAGTSEDDMWMMKAAKVMKVVFYGFMVSGFFLSRTYTPILYLLFGMIAALVSMKKEGEPAFEPIPQKINVPVTSFVIGCLSIGVFYVVVNLR